MEGHWGYAAIETLAGNIEQVMADIFFGIVGDSPSLDRFLLPYVLWSLEGRSLYYHEGQCS